MRLESTLVKITYAVVIVLTLLWAQSRPLLAQPSAPASAPVLRLADAITFALEQNRDLKLAEVDVDKAAQQIEVARTNRLPRLNVSFLDPIVPTDLELKLGPLGALPLPHNFAFALGTATQPISQLYDIKLGIQAATLSKEVASERVRSARQTIVNEVTRAYYECLQAQSGLKPARDAVDLFRELERVIGTLVDERAALDADRLDVQARRAQQEHDVLVLEDLLATGRERLNIALARDPGTPFALEDIPVSIADRADAVEEPARVLGQRPDLRQARLTIDLARVDERLSKAQRLPRVGALFSYVGTINMPLLPGNIAMAVITASWEPFDWGRRSREIAVKSLAVKQAETQAAQLSASITVELNARSRALREARSLVGVTELGERASDERLRVMMNRRNETAVLAKDLLEAQVGVAEADHRHQAALLSYWEARADYEKASGADQ
ncbi:MAG TPA: TolC family protein [Vicinamibacterales bacterium]|jgi:outer membrane protein TolC|nr:TolC family protein [Vicinamibacterales bacterium]